jgi:large subunit ribosomal protein L18
VSIQSKIKAGKQRRKQRVRKKVVGAAYQRVSVFRSLNHIYAQLIDDRDERTLASCSTLELKKLSGEKKERAKAVGVELAKRILAQGIDRVVFDRGQYLFHGRVKAVAEGLKEGGVTL